MGTERAQTRFRDRNEAGRFLAARLSQYAGRSDVLVLGLPRGGVVVAYEVAQALGAPLEVCVVRKLPAPGAEELAIGAIGSHGTRVVNQELVRSLGISEETLQAIIAQEETELKRREKAYRDHRPAPRVEGKTVLLIDDGLATGSTMRAAVHTLRAQHPARLVVAVPTAAPDTCEEMRQEADEVLCAITPEPFYAVGLWYEDFTQVTDEEVRKLLAESHQRR